MNFEVFICTQAELTLLLNLFLTEEQILSIGDNILES